MTVTAAKASRSSRSMSTSAGRTPSASCATFPVVFDAAGATPAAFDVKGMPSSYLIDRNGIVVAVEEGFHDEHVAALEARIRALLATR